MNISSPISIRHTQRSLFVIFIALLLTTLFADVAHGTGGITARQVVDLNQRTGDSFPDRLAQLPNAILLVADSGDVRGLPIGYDELWRSDGTANGTYRLGNVGVRREGSFVDDWPVSNGITYFHGYDVDHGVALWRTNGTTSGTYLVRDFSPDLTTGSPRVRLVDDNWFVEVDSQLYGLSNDQLTLLSSSRINVMGEFGRNLLYTANNQFWRSDGTVAGTQSLTTLTSSSTYLMHQTETHLYLLNGSRMLVMDGTPAGTQQLISGIDRTYFVEDSSQLTDRTVFLWIRTTSNAEALYRTNGTPAGTFPILSLTSSQLVNRIFQVGSQRYFFIADNNRSTALWQTNGTAAGTQPVVDPLPVSLGYFGQLDLGSALLYGRQQLWRTGGTAATTVPINNALPISSSSPLEWGGYLHFLVQSPGSFDTPVELWRSDGRSAEKVNTLEALDIYIYGTAGFFQQDNHFYIIAESPTTSERDLILWMIDLDRGTATRLADDVGFNYGDDQNGSLKVGKGDLFMFVNFEDEIWRTDGTIAGTYRLGQSARRNTTDYPIGFLGEINGRWLFAGQDEQHGVELWSTDGSAANTHILKDVHTNSAPSNPKLLQQVGNRVCYVVEDDGENDHALYCSDGATIELIESRPVSNSFGSNFRGGMIGHHLYYIMLTADGTELWRTNGTRAGTFYTGVDEPVHFFPLTSATTPNGIHYYVISNVVAEGSKFIRLSYHLWRTDGTPAGTFKLQDLYEGDWTIAPHQLTAVGNQIYFYAYTPNAGMELWRSDGWNTQMVRDIRPGRESSKPAYTTVEMTAVNGTLYFWADDGVHGRELWKSNGTAATTQMVRDIQTGSGSSWLKNLTAVGNRLFFTPATSQGYELWTSYGTYNGTYMVKDIFAPWGSADPQLLTPHHNGVLFSADDGTHGRQLWRSDGTGNGTYRLTNFTGGAIFQEIVTTWNGVYLTLNDGSVWRSDGYSMNVTRVTSSTGRPFFARQAHPRQNIVAVQNRVFLSGHDGGGNELWVIEP